MSYREFRIHRDGLDGESRFYAAILARDDKPVVIDDSDGRYLMGAMGL